MISLQCTTAADSWSWVLNLKCRKDSSLVIPGVLLEYHIFFPSPLQSCCQSNVQFTSLSQTSQEWNLVVCHCSFICDGPKRKQGMMLHIPCITLNFSYGIQNCESCIIKSLLPTSPGKWICGELIKHKAFLINGALEQSWPQAVEAACLDIWRGMLCFLGILVPSKRRGGVSQLVLCYPDTIDMLLVAN